MSSKISNLFIIEPASPLGILFSYSLPCRNSATVSPYDCSVEYLFLDAGKWEVLCGDFSESLVVLIF